MLAVVGCFYSRGTFGRSGQYLLQIDVFQSGSAQGYDLANCARARKLQTQTARSKVIVKPDLSVSPSFRDEPCSGLTIFDEMLSTRTLRSLRPGKHLFHQGDNDRNIYKIELGHIRLYHLMSDGQRQIISFKFAGDFLGLQAEAERHCGAETVTSVRIRSLDWSSVYRRIRNEPALAPLIVSLLSRELDDARDQIAGLRRPAIEKLAAFILELHRRQGESGMVEIPFSRTDIADFLCLTIETVSRNLTKLRTKRIVELQKHHSLVILDFDSLQTLADGEREYW